MIDKKLVTWSIDNYSHLPWRKKRSLYKTLVSEIMLQQTTVSTVLARFDKFLIKFSDLNCLADASETEVCAAWEGLGYYRRARNLRKAAISIVEEFGGEFPQSIGELKSIPGIGDYTANAIVAIGMNHHALGIDANLERVLSRYYYLEEEKGLKLHNLIKNKFEKNEILQNIETLGARDLHESLMDLGRVVCRSKKTECEICPIKEGCRSYNKKGVDTTLLPIQVKKSKPKKENVSLLRIVVRHGNKVLGYRKSDKEWLSSQIELPTFTLSTTDEKFKQYPVSPYKKWKADKGSPIKTTITKYKIENYCLEMTKAEFDKKMGKSAGKAHYKYYKLSQSHFSSASVKVLSAIS